jgi:hypothetical protein
VSEPGASLPWTDDSIFKRIRHQLDPVSGALPEHGMSLPDGEKTRGGMRYAPGAWDGILGHHMASQDDPEKGRTVAELLDSAARSDRAAAVVECYELLKEDAVFSIIDTVIEKLVEMRTPLEPLKALSLAFATRSRDRGPVKAGIALLGAVRAVEHQDAVISLGRHDEFTLYAAVALQAMLPDPLMTLWDLARHVRGWGRIQVVERLVPTGDVELQKWLRTEGFRNSIMHEYLALTAATHGQLLPALERSTLAADELVGASDLLQTLIAADHGPAAGMGFYNDAAAACSEFLRHVSAAQPDLRHLRAAGAILSYVTEDDREDAERMQCGWNEASTAHVQSQARGLIERPVWEPMARSALDSTDDAQFALGDECARLMGLDTFAWHWKRVEAHPLESRNWHAVMRTVNSHRIGQLVQFAERVLPLEAIATGAADELGMGAGFEPHNCLVAVLQDLKDYPGQGRTLIYAGLRSPVVRSRNMALNALEAWEPALRAELKDVLERALQEEVDDQVRERVKALLNDSGPLNPDNA